MERCSTTRIIREMQIKTTMRYHLTPVRMAVIKRQEITSAGEGVEKGNPPTLLVGMSLGAATVENSMKFLQKIKNRTTISPAIPLLGIYPKKTKTIKKMVIGTYISIITLNVNGLNAPTKRHRLAEWNKNKTHIYAVYKRPTSDLGTHTD